MRNSQGIRCSHIPEHVHRNLEKANCFCCAGSNLGAPVPSFLIYAGLMLYLSTLILVPPVVKTLIVDPASLLGVLGSELTKFAFRCLLRASHLSIRFGQYSVVWPVVLQWLHHNLLGKGKFCVIWPISLQL
uniref:Uncharacterized protein n=1 Tax=Picea glauca TaxID=3330 RepID=A0A101M2C0_PICGL|nr:hypothetical protein ABT39_MTgene2854 [Picea glauca]